jgi:hypothetical protein
MNLLASRSLGPISAFFDSLICHVRSRRDVDLDVILKIWDGRGLTQDGPR